MTRSAIVAAAATLIACGGSPPPKTVSVRMAGGPGDATVTIDDRFVGRLEVIAARGVAVPPGVHRVSVEAPGYFPLDKVVEAREGAPLRLEVRLVRVPD